jgi:hypothetical protein
MRRPGPLSAVLASAACLLAISSQAADAGRQPFPSQWTEQVIGTLEGAAFSTLGDLDGDGRAEVVATSFGKVAGFGPTTGGTVASYHRTDAGWQRADIITPADGIQFPNEPTLADVDGDGLTDVVQPGGFFICTPCGSLSWWHQTPAHTWQRHDLVAAGNPAFFHRAELVDIDGDGDRDLVTVAETAASATTVVFPGTGTGFDTTPVALGEGLGSLPTVVDVDHDGDLDIASAQYFSRNGSFAWLERVASGPAGGAGSEYGVYTKHVIAADLGGAIQLSRVPGIGWVGTNHTNTTSGPPGTATSGVYLLTPGSDPRLPWSARLISDGIVSRADTGAGQQQGAPGVFRWGDVDRDGDTDLIVSGDGDRRLFVIEQTGRGQFATHAIADQRGQAGVAGLLRTRGGAALVFSSYDAGLVSLYRPSSPAP